MIYTVKRGDTLSEIAKTFGVDMWDLANANGIRNPNVIHVGQRLTIPATDDTNEEDKKYAKIGRAFVSAVKSLDMMSDFKELSGLLE